MSKNSTNKLSYAQKLKEIKKSIRIGSYINASTQHYKKWLEITSIENIPEPISNRSNVTLHITTKRIDINTIDRPDKILYLADLLQFALIDESS